MADAPGTAVLLSGGVDSSVALTRLARGEGPETAEGPLTAFYLKIWLEDELAFLGDCPWQEDLDYAEAVCGALDIPLEVVPLQQEYRRRIVEHTLDGLAQGQTPSPDVWCNRRIKFGAFLEVLAKEEARSGRRFAAVASGHYAGRRSAGSSDDIFLLRSPDPVKDQTYFLSQLTQEQLRRCRFPLGDLSKPEVRALAERWRLPNRHRPDSQGICFLGQIPVDEFVRHHLGERRGEIRERGSGRVLGEHQGHWFFTTGQRRGLGLSGGPWYVVEKEPEENLVWVVHGESAGDFARDRLRVESPHWITVPPVAERWGSLHAKVRHGPALIPATLAAVKGAASPEDGGPVEVHLAEADPGLAPGQLAVLYDGEVCLGGGVMRPAPL